MNSYICSKSTPVHFQIESVITSSTVNEWLIQRASETNAEVFEKLTQERLVITTDLLRSVGDKIQKSNSRVWRVSGVMDWDDDELVAKLHSINGVKKFNVVF